MIGECGGGGLYLSESNTKVINCAIAYNRSYCVKIRYASTVEIRNCIIAYTPYG